MTLLLDTHFLIWLVLGSDRLAEFPWLDRYRPWGVSPVSFLEIQFLAEIGRLSVSNPEFTSAVMDDPRFSVDDIALVALVRHGLKLWWTRDPSTASWPPTAWRGVSPSAPSTGVFGVITAWSWRSSHADKGGDSFQRASAERTRSEPTADLSGRCDAGGLGQVREVSAWATYSACTFSTPSTAGASAVGAGAEDVTEWVTRHLARFAPRSTPSSVKPVAIAAQGAPRHAGRPGPDEVGL